MLGPRLNAAGRLDSAMAALQLLLSNDVQEAGQLAQQLNYQNQERQELTRQVQQYAEQLAFARYPDSKLLFAADPGFNPGVVGLAASRLVEAYHRPAIVAYLGEESTRASCRSIPGFHITNALDQCADLLLHHGGHSAAAGFTVLNNNLDELIERLVNLADRQITDDMLQPVLNVDLEIPLTDLKPAILAELDKLQPTGIGNPQAYFVSRGLRATRKQLIGNEGHHLKLAVTDGRITYDAIAFNMAEWFESLPARFDLLFTFERNDWNGRTYLQLNVKDIRPSQ
jgi:single-stranded-DNA-specific exonuclease